MALNERMPVSEDLPRNSWVARSRQAFALVFAVATSACGGDINLPDLPDSPADVFNSDPDFTPEITGIVRAGQRQVRIVYSVLFFDPPACDAMLPTLTDPRTAVACPSLSGDERIFTSFSLPPRGAKSGDFFLSVARGVAPISEFPPGISVAGDFVNLAGSFSVQTPVEAFSCRGRISASFVGADCERIDRVSGERQAGFLDPLDGKLRRAVKDARTLVRRLHYGVHSSVLAAPESKPRFVYPWD